MLIIRGVNVFPTQVEEQVLAVAQLAPHFQLEVSREKNLDVVTVLVELRPQSATEEHADAARRALRERIKSLVGISCEIRTGPPGSVPRSLGKAQRVIDRRNSQ